MDQIQIDLTGQSMRLRAIRFNPSSRDLIQRKVLIEPDDEGVNLWLSDGITKQRIHLDGTIVGDWEPFVADVQLISRMILLEGVCSFLREKDEEITLAINSGSIAVPTFRMGSEYFRITDLEASIDSWSYTKEQWKSLISRMYALVKQSYKTSPGQAYLYLGADGAYASDGRIIAHYQGTFPNLAIRYKDAALLKLFIDRCTNEHIVITRHHDCYALQASGHWLVLRDIAASMSADWKACPKKAKRGFVLDRKDILNCTRVLGSFKTAASVIRIVMDKGSLSLTSEVRGGRESALWIHGATPIGDDLVSGVYPVEDGVLLNALRAAQGDIISLGIDERGMLQLWDDTVLQTVMLRAG